MKKYAAVGLASVMMLAAAGTAQAETVLRVSSWAPPSHHVNSRIFPNWIACLEEKSGGSLTGKIEYGLASPPEQPQLIASGGADATWMFHGYNPGRYELQQIAEMPGLGASAEAVSQAYWKVYQKHFKEADEHRGLTVVGLMVHGPAALHTKDKVTSWDQLEQMKIRVPGGVGTEVVKILGAQGVGVPAPKVYETLAQGVADGVVFPMETAVSFKVAELAQNMLYVDDGMYYGAFAIPMNPARIESLSDADRDALWACSGERLSREAGRSWDQADLTSFEAVEASNDIEFVVADEAMSKAYYEMVQPIREQWIEMAKGKGVDGEAALADMEKWAKEYDEANDTVGTEAWVAENR